MTTAQAVAAAKSRLSITNTTYDTLLTGFVPNAVSRLYPTASLEVDLQTVTSFTVDQYGEVSLNLTTLTKPCRAVRQVEAFVSGGWWERITDTYHHGSFVRLREVPTGATSLRFYGLNVFPAIDDVYDWLTQSVIWFMMAEFYDMMAGNEADYSSYMQTTGARAVDNLADQSTLFETKAQRYLESQAQNYGL